MIIWDNLTVQNSDNTAKIVADQGEITDFKVTGTATLPAITYVANTHPTAKFYNLVLDNSYFQLNGSYIYNQSTAIDDWAPTKMLTFDNCKLGRIIRVIHNDSTNDKLWNLDFGPRLRAITNNGNAVFLRIRCLKSSDTSTAIQSGFALKMGIDADSQQSALEVRSWDDQGSNNEDWRGIHVKWVKAQGDIRAESFTATSDRRLKTNIQPWKPTGSILDLPIYSFNYISDNSYHIGCLAQDLQQICPEIVHQDANTYLHIEESKIVYLLLQEVKQLKKDIELLKKQHEH